jgi:putative membrane protein
MEINPFNSIFTQWRDYGWGHGPGMMDWGYGIGWFGLIMMGIFGILIIVAIIFLIRGLIASSSFKSHGLKSEESAIEILKRRYARGEINKEEFLEKKKDLT